nr:MAG TPA: hypothetical protein [Caudoviricetes sp.]
MLNHFFTSFVVLILLLYIFVFNTKAKKYSLSTIFFSFLMLTFAFYGV